MLWAQGHRVWTQVPPTPTPISVPRLPGRRAAALPRMLGGYVCAKRHRKGRDGFHRNRYSGTFASSDV